MGCFSFMCNECDKPVLSNSFSGEKVKLFLLKDGKVLQEMEGEYDSYGRVFIEGTQHPDVNHSLQESVYWNDPCPDIPPTENEQYFINKNHDHWKWSRVCDLMFSQNPGDGIAAIHSECFKTVPTTESESDPNQGWGEYEDNEELD